MRFLWRTLAPPVLKSTYGNLRLFLSPHSEASEVRRWWRDGGDAALRYSYPLGPASVVIDLGGYKGDFASEIYARYRCKVHVFEPVAHFAAEIATRFARNPDITVYPVALAANDGTIRLGVDAESSSSFREGEQFVEGRAHQILEWLSEREITSVALLKLNIEGGEYDLLEHLLATHAAAMFDVIQVQFHNVAANSRMRMEAIRNGLEKTHTSDYCYEFVWESWRKRV